MNRLFGIVHGNKKNTGGFTVTELLMVVAVLVVLCSLVVLSLVKMQKELRQKELDSKAEIIYVAAQNRITELKAQGLKAKYETNAVPLGFIPYDADKSLTSEEAEYYFASSAGKDDETMPSHWLLPLGAVDEELHSANWIIEFNIKSGTVYSVFYSEEPITKTSLELDYLRSKDTRLADGARIGYYGGDVAIIQTTREFEIRKLNIINEETLTAEIIVRNPVSESFKLTYWLEDAAGNKTAEKEITAKTFIGGGEYTASLNLDNLTNSASRFHSLFPELDAGADFTLHVSAGIPTNPLIKKATREETENSLFAARQEGSPEDTAYIKFGRHLQNLDKDSGVYEGITKAVQEHDIFFSENGEDENAGKLWLDVYGTKKLTAIDNPNLAEYSGSDENPEAVPTIFGVNIAPNSSAEAAAGLFAKTYDGMTIKNVGLSGTTIVSGKYSGAFVGKSEGNLTVEGCFVILSGEKGDLDGKMKTDVSLLESRIAATDAAGGIIGYAGNGAEISKSFAATIVRGGNNSRVGGLCGASGGILSVSESYADCYLFGSAVGGISGNTNVIDIKDSYSVGYITATGTAYGISGGAISSTSARSYTAVHTTNGRPFYSTAASGAAPVYYLEEGSDETKNLGGTIHKSFAEMSSLTEFADLLGDKFTTSTGGSNSEPYNLLAQGLVDYSYPKLAGTIHYGDWNAEFVTAQLVYFEEYQNGSYGFSGANKDNLRDAGSSTYAVGDGYALVFDSDTKPAPGSRITFRIQLSSDGTMSPEYAINSGSGDFKTVTDDNGDTFYLLPIRSGETDPINMGYEVKDSDAPSAFYRNIIIDNEGNTDTYYFNPHFAKTVTSELPERAPSYIYIRSPRQLYWMSMEYTDYADFTESGTNPAIFRQETALHYNEYKWDNYFPTDERNFANGKLISQEPIGTEGDPFTGIYDGTCCSISGVSFATDKNHVGLFGVNLGRISNTVLTKSGIASADETESIRRLGTIIHSGTNVYMGVLCGINRGTINNCAVANYTAKVDVNQGAVLILGGICGENSGIISNSSAVISNFEVSSLYSTIYAGGFTGANQGTIRYCYALGAITVKGANSTRPVKIAGFAADNSGDISYCYCATSLSTSGTAVSSAFSPADIGSMPKNSYYVNDGTYYFTDSLYAYKFGDDYGIVGPQSVKAEELKRTNISRYFGTVRNCSYDKYGNFYPGETDYPFPAIVKDGFGNFIHYGDWVVEANLGEIGVFYWEYEEGSGSNSGYHISFNGIEGNSVISGSTLCNVHDDGGVISSYGYGYYYKTGTNAPSLTVDGRNSTRYTRNTDAEAGLHIILPEFNFVAYTSGTPRGTNYNPDGVLFIEEDAANSVWRLTPYGNNAVTHTFEVCPFFADAINYDYSGYYTVIPADEATEGKNDNYRNTLGEENNKYQIRSAEQLQYINWNSSTDNAVTAINAANYSSNTTIRRYPYLKYTNPYNNAATGYNFYWDQTHDVAANQTETEKELFTPIGSFYDSEDGALTSNVIGHFAYFGGVYDGRDFVIKNIEIDSSAQMTGLFGITVGAKLENIVLYSEFGNTIKANDQGRKWYCLGGLVGFAAKGTGTESVFTNCTVSGYKIVDERKNSGQWGGANIGGLAGATNMNITGCTSVNDIDVYLKYTAGYNNVRVGGLVGGCRSTVSSCYCGGSIVSKTQYQGPDPSSSTNIWIGGITGGVVMKNDGNLSSLVGSVTGYVSVNDCYTYVNLPESGSNQIRNVQSIASNGEMMCVSFKPVTNPSITINNSYALALNQKADDYKFLRNITNWTTAGINVIDRAGGAAYMDMNEITIRNARSPYLTYDDMDVFGGNRLKGYLGDTFGVVTTQEANGAAVNGKYSFAGSDLALEGKNYPFPTVLTQKSLVDGSTVNVHYGEWTKVGLFWSESMNYIDIFRDYSEETHEVTKDIKLVFEGLEIANPDKDNFTISYYQDNKAYIDGTPQEFATPTDIPVVVSVTDENNDGIFETELKAQNTGACYVRASYNDNGTIYSADCYVYVSADFTVTANPTFDTVYVGDTDKKIELKVTSENVDGTKKNLIGFFDRGEIIKDKEQIIYYDDAQPVGEADKFTFTYDALNEGDLKLTFKAYLKLTLNGIERTFTNSAFVNISVKKEGRIGISAPLGEETTGYFEAALPRDEETATGVTYNSAAADYSAAPNKPALEGETVFLYANGTGVDIESFALNKIEVLKEGTVDATVYNNGTTDYTKYFVEIGSTKAEEEDLFFDYRTIRINGTENASVEIRATFSYFGDTYVVTAPVTIVASEPKAIFVDPEGRTLHEKTYAYGEVPAMTAEDWDSADAAANTAATDLGYHCNREAGTVPAFAAIYVDTKYSVTLLPNTYTVKFNKAAEDATGTLADISAVYDTPFRLPDTTFERLGYKQTGWSTEQGTFDLSQLVSNLTTVNGGTVTLSAVWEEVPNYDIEFNVNGGAGTAATITGVKYGETKPLPGGTGITKTGNTFVGWARSQTATSSIGDSAKNLTDMGGTATLYAVWQKNSYNLKYVYGNGTAEKTESRLFEEEITLAEPTWTGHTFKGWYIGENLVESLTMPDSDVTVTAHWTINQYIVSFNTDGGTPTAESVTQDYGTAVTLPTVTRTGFRFLGWSDGTSTYTSTTGYSVPAKDITLTAQWEEITHRVVFNSNGGNSADEYTGDYREGSKITLPRITRSGIYLSYWTDGINTHNAGTEYTVTRDITLYAKWNSNYMWFVVVDGKVTSAGNINGRTISHDLNSTNYTVYTGYPDNLRSVGLTGNGKDRNTCTLQNRASDDIYIVAN